MAELIISCLSQKGGVGKSTLARLIATAYAAHEQRVGIYDFNATQKTSTFWAGLRKDAGINPPVVAEVSTQAARMRRDDRFDVILADGRPDSPDITLAIAMASDLVVIPTSFAMDDLVPQRRFALELLRYGVDKSRMLFVLNRVVEHKGLTDEALEFLSDFPVAKAALPYRASFVRAHTAGLSVGEVGRLMTGNLSRLSAITEALSTEIASQAMELTNE